MLDTYMKPLELDPARLLGVLIAFRNGDYSVRMPCDLEGVPGKIADTLNEILEMENDLLVEYGKVATAVSQEGRIHTRVKVPKAGGAWLAKVEFVNSLMTSLAHPMAEVARVIGAVARGDLTQRVADEVEGRPLQGEFLRISREVNGMVMQLGRFASEVARVAREVGTEGKLGGQADVEKVAGTWKGLTDDVNSMASNLTSQVRNIAEVTIAVANGLKKSQALAQELQSQQEEMTETNKGLEAQTTTLRESQALLERRQQELKRANQELEQRARHVSRQMAELEATRSALQAKAEGQQQDLQEARRELEERAQLVAERKAEVEESRSALQAKAEQLALATKYKSEFLANMSHDLRTPLNSLLILSRFLEENHEGNLTARQMEHAATIHAAGEDLLELINDVLHLSKIESGTMTVEVSEVVLRGLFRFVERTFRPVAEGKGLGFEIHVDPALPRVVRTDRRRLQQVLRNILSNAFKFTPQGEVVLSVAPAASGWTPGHPHLEAAEAVLAFSVRDTGIGIDPAKHAMVFEAFQQADGSTSRTFGGTGLGLSISRGIATLLGGEIRLQSALGQGSTFTLYLPAENGGPGLARAVRRLDRAVLEEVRTAGRPDPGRPDPGPPRRRLLLVEDDPAQCMATRELLEGSGVETVVAGTGREALEAMDAGCFDCMVLDLNLPDLTGIEVLRRLRAERGRIPLPVVVHTARDLTEREEVELMAMAEAIVVKEPYSPERVFDETALFLGRAQDPAPRVAAPGCVALAREGTLRGRRILMVDDDARNIFALRAVLEDKGLEVVPAATGQEALDRLRIRPDIDLVLMDIMLPGMDGLDTTRAIRAQGPFARLPIIALTAKAMPGDRDLCLAAGASDYIPKPVDTGRLLALMERRLRAQGGPADQDQPAKGQPPPQPPPVAQGGASAGAP